MNHTNEDGMNVLEAAIFLVFSRSDERFVMFLMENMYGINNHHIVESSYKALARAMRQAIEIDPRKSDAIPSTKGMLGDKSD